MRIAVDLMPVIDRVTEMRLERSNSSYFLQHSLLVVESENLEDADTIGRVRAFIFLVSSRSHFVTVLPEFG